MLPKSGASVLHPWTRFNSICNCKVLYIVVLFVQFIVLCSIYMMHSMYDLEEHAVWL